MTTQQDTELKLQLTVRQSVTVLPRCLQILSRRGFMLTELVTYPQDSETAVLALTASGDARWHDAVPHLLSRLVDVLDVQKKDRHV